MLYLQVLKGDCVGTAGDDVMKPVIRKCLHDAALVNYERVSEHANVEGEQLHES